MTSNSSIRPVGQIETIVIVVVAIVVLVAIPIVAWFCVSSTMNWETTITEKDIPAQSDRHEFVNQFLASPLPESAKVDDIEYATWLDWNLTVEILMDPSDAMTYLKTVRLQPSINNQTETKLSQPDSEFEAIFHVTIDRECNGHLIYSPERETLTVTAPDFEPIRKGQPAG